MVSFRLCRSIALKGSSTIRSKSMSVPRTHDNEYEVLISVSTCTYFSEYVVLILVSTRILICPPKVGH